MASFSKLNGYDVKDAQARESIEEINTQITGYDDDFSEINTKLSDHDDDISTINTKLSDHDNDISTINTKLSDHDDDISDINTKLSDHDDDISDINTRINDGVLTELVVFGDSWSDPNIEGVVWPSMVATNLNLNIHNYALSGAGFVDPSTNLVSSQITTATNDTSYNKRAVKYVVIAGGINDYLREVTMTDLKNAIISIHTACKTLYPNAKILYANNFKYPYDDLQTNYWYGLQYQLATIGINVLNQDGYYRKVYFLDNLFHLTSYGQTVYGSNIIAALSGGQIKNMGVTIPLENNKGTIWLQRNENLLMYVLKFENLSSNASETITPTDQLCWGSRLNFYMIGSVNTGYNRAVCQVNANGSFTIAKEDATQTYVAFNGVTPITTGV